MLIKKVLLVPTTLLVLDLLGMSTTQAGESPLLASNRYSAAHKIVPAAVSPHHAAVTAEVTAAPDAVTYHGHVALWRSFDVQAGVCGTQPAAINDRGETTGSYYDASCNSHGFLRKADGTIVTFDAPNVGYPAGTPTPYPGTAPTDINNEGDIVGSYTDAAGATHGFVRWRWGTFTVIDDPSSTSSSPPATYAQAINDWGVVVGYWYDLNGNSHGFVRQLGGFLIPFEPARAIYSQGYHINDLGEAGGDWSDATTSHGMLLHLDGKLVTFDAPNAVATFGGLGQALNLEGSFVGTWVDNNGGTHGYERYANGNFSEFTAPGGGTSGFQGTWAASINLLGTVVGYSIEQNGSTDGYVRFARGALILVDAPVTGQQSTVAWAINDLNEFTGFWYDAQGNEHGFVALAVP